MSSSIRNKRFQPNGVVRYYILSVIGMGSIIPFRALAWKVAFAYLLSVTLFGAFGSMISMRKHLNV